MRQEQRRAPRAVHEYPFTHLLPLAVLERFREDLRQRRHVLVLVLAGQVEHIVLAAAVGGAGGAVVVRAAVGVGFVGEGGVGGGGRGAVVRADAAELFLLAHVHVYVHVCVWW